jgi:hypothetical protein
MPLGASAARAVPRWLSLAATGSSICSPGASHTLRGPRATYKARGAAEARGEISE